MFAVDSKNSRKLLFFRGIPGSGKSAVSNYLNQQHGMQILDPDFVDIFSPEFKEFKSTFPQLTRLKNLKYRFLLNKAVAQINSGKSFIWCQPWRKSESLKTTLDNINFQNLISDGWEIYIVELLIDPKTAWQRLKDAKNYKIKIFKTYKSFYDYCTKFKDLEPFDKKVGVFSLDANSELQTILADLETLLK